jgi:hypothetical protein
MRIELFYGMSDYVPVESYPPGDEPPGFNTRPAPTGQYSALLRYRLCHDIHGWLVDQGERTYSWGFRLDDAYERSGIGLWFELEKSASVLLFKLTWGGK